GTLHDGDEDRAEIRTLAVTGLRRRRLGEELEYGVAERVVGNREKRRGVLPDRLAIGTPGPGEGAYTNDDVLLRICEQRLDAPAQVVVLGSLLVVVVRGQGLEREGPHAWVGVVQRLLPHRRKAAAGQQLTGFEPALEGILRAGDRLETLAG